MAKNFVIIMRADRNDERRLELTVTLTCVRRTGRQLDVDVVVRPGERVAVTTRRDDRRRRRRTASILDVVSAVPVTTA